MTRYAIDTDVALRLIRDGSDADGRHKLVGPSVLRSHALATLYRTSERRDSPRRTGADSSSNWRR